MLLTGLSQLITWYPIRAQSAWLLFIYTKSWKWPSAGSSERSSNTGTLRHIVLLQRVVINTRLSLTQTYKSSKKQAPVCVPLLSCQLFQKKKVFSFLEENNNTFCKISIQKYHFMDPVYQHCTDFSLITDLNSIQWLHIQEEANSTNSGFWLRSLQFLPLGVSLSLNSR